jgi:hypothetical protein
MIDYIVICHCGKEYCQSQTVRSSGGWSFCSEQCAKLHDMMDIKIYYIFTDEKDAKDVPALKLNQMYYGENDDGQLIDIYEQTTSRFVGTFCAERFQKLGSGSLHG